MTPEIGVCGGESLDKTLDLLVGGMITGFNFFLFYSAAPFRRDEKRRRREKK